MTNGKLIRLFVDDEPFDVRYGELRAHERVLDFRAGTLSRRAEWVSPAGQAVRVSSTRLVSFTQRAIAAISYEVEPLDGPARIAVQSELLANEQLPPPGGDPRVAAVLDNPLISEYYAGRRDHSSCWCTRPGEQRAARRRGDGSSDRRAGRRAGRVAGLRRRRPGHGDDRPAAGAAAARDQVRRLRLVGSERSLQGVRDQVWAALSAARQTGWDGLLAEQRAYLDDFWDRADVEVDGDTEVQQAVRFGLFHVLQAGARRREPADPGEGADRARLRRACLLGYRDLRPAGAHPDGPRRGAPARCAGGTARFRRPSSGPPSSGCAARPSRGGRSPDRNARATGRPGTAAFHINADIADAVLRYVDATGDEDFARGPGIDLLTHTARLWRSLGHHDANGRFHIDGVTGPDEYSAIADDNVYTNLMARQNLVAAADAARRYPDRARELGVDAEESAGWRDAAKAMFIPYDESLGVHPQAEGFTRHQVWDFAETSADQYPLLLHFPYFDLYRKQVVKQADLVLAMHLCGEAFTAEQKARNFDYYEPLTVRDSSLSACTQAVMAAEVGHLDLAFDYLGEAALMDLRDLENNTRDGVHIASLAGTWIALVGGFGGLRHRDGMVSFAPRLPEGLTRLAFTILLRGGACGWR